MDQIYIWFWLWILTAVENSFSFTINPCGPQAPWRTSTSGGPPATDPIILSTIRPPPCDIINKINLASDEAKNEFANVSSMITSSITRELLNVTHYEGELPFTRNADSSLRNTIEDLFVQRKHVDKIFQSNNSSLSNRLQDLICAIARHAGIQGPLRVRAPVVTNDHFFDNLSESAARERNYIVFKDVMSYLLEFRSQVNNTYDTKTS